VLSSVEVLRQGDPAPEAEVAHGHRVGACGRAPGHGGCSTRPLELRATAPVQANHLEAGGVVLSSVEVLRDWAQGDLAPRRHTGTVSTRVAARQATRGTAPAGRGPIRQREGRARGLGGRRGWVYARRGCAATEPGAGRRLLLLVLRPGGRLGRCYPHHVQWSSISQAANERAGRHSTRAG